jgi:hypothetical protein
VFSLSYAAKNLAVKTWNSEIVLLKSSKAAIMKLQIKNSFHKNYFKTSSIKRIQPPFAFSASFIILSSFLCTMQAVAPTPVLILQEAQKYRETFAPALQNVFLLFFSVRKFNLLLQAASARANECGCQAEKAARTGRPHVS